MMAIRPPTFSTSTSSSFASVAAAVATRRASSSSFAAAAAAPSSASSFASVTAAAAAAAAAAATTTTRRVSSLVLPFSSFRPRSHLDFPRRESPLQRLFFGKGGPRGSGADNSDTVLYSLIGLNVAIYALWQVNPTFARKHFVVSAAALSEGRVWTAVTSAFSHRDGMSHLAVNMISLFFFGRSVGAALGGRALLSLYLAAGAG